MKTAKMTVWLAIWVLLAVIYAAPAGAATPYTGEKITVQEYLVMDKDAALPDVDVTLSVQQGSAVAATDETLRVIPGRAGVSFPSKVSFHSGDTATAESAAGSSEGIDFLTKDNNNDEKYIAKTVELDFTGVSFVEEGVYRYVIEQTSVSRPDVTSHLTTCYLDIYVADVGGDLQNVGVAFKQQADAPSRSGNVSVPKLTGFTNSFTTHSLTVKKNVDGNQGSQDKYFKFTLQLTGSSGGSSDSIKLAVSGIFDRDAYDNSSNAYTKEEIDQANAFVQDEVSGQTFITVGQLKNEKVFYLRHGQTLKIGGIPMGMGYKVSEVFEDYQSVSQVTGDGNGTQALDSENKKASVTDTNLEADTTVLFTNTREGTVPTGIVNGVIIPIVVWLIGVSGAGLVLHMRRVKNHIAV